MKHIRCQSEEMPRPRNEHVLSSTNSQWAYGDPKDCSVEATAGEVVDELDKQSEIVPRCFYNTHALCPGRSVTIAIQRHL